MKNLHSLFKNIILLAAIASTPTKTQAVHQHVKTTGLVAAVLGASGIGRYFYMQNQYGNPPTETFKFFLEGLKPGNQVGTVMPCSKYLGQTLTAKLPYGTATKPLRFLDAGAGTGTVSAEILKYMGPHCSLDLVELEESLCAILREKFKDDKRVTVHCGSILDFNPGYTFNGIITTIPFNDPSFNLGFTQSIWEKFQSLSAKECIVSYVNYCFPPKLIKMCASVGLCKNRHKNMSEKNKYLDGLYVSNGFGQKIETRNYPDIRIRYFQFNNEEKDYND